MPDPRFFVSGPDVSVKDALKLINAHDDQATLFDEGDVRIAQAAAPETADLQTAAVFCINDETAAALSSKSFGLCITTEKFASLLQGKGAIIISASPRAAFARLASALHCPIRQEDTTKAPVIGGGSDIHETAIISAGVEIGAGAEIGAYAVIGPNVVIGSGVRIGAHASVGFALIGENVSILAGARIGEAGFGFASDAAGLVRVPQLGRVIIGDHVEIGANSCVDRGALGDTVIKAGAKIDNLVQIGHNVTIGRNSIIAAQAGLSGSVSIGDNVLIGGQVGIADQVSVGDGAALAAQAGLMRDVPAGERWGGTPARRARDWLRETAALSKLANPGKGRKSEKT
ncbi:MAG: UDP-3-O-(3-hydroxymyristoyl)glucosamine N-acyltransferase [Pseudomonadota bacterium]